MSRYVPRSDEDVLKLVRDYPLAWIISNGPSGFAGTPLPLLPEIGPDGRITSLLGHFARSNPQVDLLARDARAAILFQGPQGYVSPRLVSNLTWGPTWNYAVAKFDTEVRFVPEETDAALHALATALEGGHAEPWTPERMGDRYEQLRGRIIAFHAVVLGVEAKFKLGQDEAPETFDQIVAGIENQELADWMRRTVRG